VIPVYEEELKVGKRVVEQGHVRVRVYTVERPVQEGVTLREERVAVERRPVDRPAAGVSGQAFQERTIDVATHREEPVVAKEARVKEEIVVRKEGEQRTETVRDTVRRSEVEVEDDRAIVRLRPPALLRSAKSRHRHRLGDLLSLCKRQPRTKQQNGGFKWVFLM